MSGRSRDAPLRWRLLLQNGLACPRDETTDGQGPSGHHVFRSGMGLGRVTRLRGFLRGYLNWIRGFGLYDITLNGLVSAFQRCLDATSADLCLIGASSSEQVYCGLRSWASPTVMLGGRKFACGTSI